MNESIQHFDSIAREYDRWKKKSWYYYTSLKELLQRHIPAGKTILEIGTGTGGILASLEPSSGTGLDTSEGMIAVALEKYGDRPNLTFRACSLKEMRLDERFDYFVLVDVIEHVEDVESLVRDIAEKASPGTTVFVSMANPLWTPVLHILEFLRMKMPEGKHYRLPSRDVVRIFAKHGLVLKKHDTILHVPAYIPLFSPFLNALLPRLPAIRRLGVIEYFIFTPGKKSL